VNANNLKKCKQQKITAFFKWDLHGMYTNY
jgi:hypothetical protein